MGEEESAIKNILKEARDKIRLESRDRILKDGRKLTREDLQQPTKPEEFTSSTASPRRALGCRKIF